MAATDDRRKVEPSPAPQDRGTSDDGRGTSPATKLLRHRDFALLWWGGLFTLTGHATLSLALPVHVYLTTGSALATSLMFLASTLPRVLLSSLAGVFVDRWSRRGTLLVCNLLLTAGCLPLLGIEIGAGVWVVYLVAAWQATVTRFFEPAENALLPTLVPRSQLASANALNALNNNLARLAGPAAGGAVVAFAGLGGVVAVNVLLYLAAFLLIARMKTSGHVAEASPRPEGRDALRRLAAEWAQGLRLIGRVPVARLLLIASVLTAVGEGVFGVLITPFVIEVLRAGPVELGWVRSAQGIGGIVGGLAIAYLGHRWPAGTLLGLGAAFIGLIDLAIFNYPRFLGGIGPAIGLMVLVGVPAAAYGTGFATLLQTHVAGGMLGRVHGTLATAYSLALLLGIALAGGLADRVGIVPVLNVQAYGYLAAGLVVLLVLRRLAGGAAERHPRAAERHPPAPEHDPEGPSPT